MTGASFRASGATLLLVLAPAAAIAGAPSAQHGSHIIRAMQQSSMEKRPPLAGFLPSLPARPTRPLPDAVNASPFHNRLTTETSKSRAASFAADIGDFTLSLATVRSKAVRIDGLSNFAHPRFANMEADLGLETQLGAHETLGLSGTWALERRRPSIKAGPHNHYTSLSRALTLSWTGDDNFRLAVSAFGTHPMGHQSPTERLSDLAAGSPRAAKGLALTMFHPIGRDPGRLSFGFDLRQQRSEAGFADGLPAYRPETRGVLTLRARF